MVPTPSTPVPCVAIVKPPVPACNVVAAAPVAEPTVVVCAVAVDPKLQLPVPQSITTELAPVLLPTVVVWATALVPILIAPVPAVSTTEVAPVPLPMVMVFALEPVPMFTAPVEPESKLMALVVVERKSKVEPPVTVSAPLLIKAVLVPKETVPEPACRVKLPADVLQVLAALPVIVSAVEAGA